MADSSDRVRALRAAVGVAPEDGELRCLLAAALLQAGDAAEAEAVLREGLRAAPDDAALRRALVRAFHRQGKLSAALVVIEDLLRAGQESGEVHLLHARLLLDGGDLERARLAYRQAEAAGAGDVELAARLGSASPSRTPVPADAGEAPGHGAADDADDVADDADAEPAQPEGKPRISFAQVGGMEGLKEEIRRKIIHPLRHPELHRAYGKSAGGGILMYGPPGCGKTYLARATAGEAQAAFLSVGIHEVLDMWLGQSEQNLNRLFLQARAVAPCVLFFDEVDALAARRSDLRTSAGRTLINQFLAELDGVDATNDGVLVLAATNAPWHLDPAFRRPGRFDRVLFVPPPDAEARAAILRVLVRGKPVEELDYARLARRTDGFSGADLKAVVDLAVERKLDDAIRAGRPVPLTTADLARTAGEVRPTAREWFATARNYVLYANEGGLYDDVKPYLA
ncbi:MAG TPA: AAA family ATPase [Longimicrobiaceae bacterium]|nr:AAA family ATPase [Longimicrobiaceae bacterium]